MRTLLVTLVLAACGGETPATDGESTTTPSTTPSGCGDLCVGAGYDAGTEVVYGVVIECQCSGAGDAITQEECAAYCEGFDVAAENALLSGADKCVCDGTAS